MMEEMDDELVLPSNIMFDIMSRLPVESLARFRCVSDQWCKYIGDPYLGVVHSKREEPTPIIFHQNPKVPRTVCFHVAAAEAESSTISTTNHVLKDLDLEFEFVCNKPVSEDDVVTVQTLGCCNGLVVIAQQDPKALTSLTVIHPLKKQVYQLPTIPLPLPRSLLRQSCGLGFDASTNRYKMVCLFLKESVSPKDLDVVRKNIRTMVHVFGTNSWREIPKPKGGGPGPYYPVDRQAVFAHGFLYWLVSYLDRGTNEVIWFDVTKEEFGLIDPPPKTTITRKRGIKDHLVDLNGEVGLVFNDNVIMEIWVLKHKHKHEDKKLFQWVFYCKFDQNPHLPHNCNKVLGCWNKHGDILITATSANGRDQFFVYNLKAGTFNKFIAQAYDEDRHEDDDDEYEYEYEDKDERKTGIVMYPNNLFSIHGITNY